MNLNQFIYDTIAHDPSNYPELECHDGLDAYCAVRLDNPHAEDENDFGYICRYHEQYLDEDKPDIFDMAEKLSDYVIERLWLVYFWDYAGPRLALNVGRRDKVCDDAINYAERRLAELGV